MKKTLLLVDGCIYIYRSYYALPNLRSPGGEPTGAIYGTLKMFRYLEENYPNAYITCILDAKGKTFRNDIYPEYKANRSPMPDDLVSQLAPIRQAISFMGWPIISVEGIEADDVIGTLARRAREHGYETIIATSDKDMAQLVNESTLLVNTYNRETTDRANVVKKFGIGPEALVDYFALIGDKSDNIPGVTSVGPKTALRWMIEYGSLDNILANVDKFQGHSGENLRRAASWLPTARELLTIRTDCDLGVLGDPADSLATLLARKEQDIEGLRTLYERLGFNGWLRELNNRVPATPVLPAASAASDPDEPVLPSSENYETVLTQAQLDEWLERISSAELTAIDTETTSLDPLSAELAGISLSVKTAHAAYIPVAHNYLGAPSQLGRQYVLEKLRPWLESPEKKKVGQNIKYDMHIFANYGIHLRGVMHDTMLQSYVLNSHNRHDLNTLARRILDREMTSFEDICGKGASQISFDQVEIEKAAAYAAADADVTLQLHHAMWKEISRDEKLLYVYEQIEIPALAVLQKIERCGIYIDSALLTRQSFELSENIDALQKKAFELAKEPFNLNSPKQLAEILFDKLKLPVVKKTAQGAPSTNEDVLQKLAEDYPLPKVILDYRSMAKLKSTYTDKLPRMVNPATLRVHTNFAQAVAVTGRLASNDPNLQNIPVRTKEGRRIREAFVAPAGKKIVSADYSQIELRIMAHMSEDANLLQAFGNGEDIHRSTASEIFETSPPDVSSEQRRYAKVINFGLIYGMSAFGVANNLGITRQSAQNYIDRYFQRYPGVARYMENIRLSARENGFVETVFGRRLWLPEIGASNANRRQAAERAAINAPMQGTAADIIKLSMVAVADFLEKEMLQSSLILQVHDELVLEVPDEELDVICLRLPELMSRVADLKVPLIVQIGAGNNWDEAH